jgi:filamentous hemagglutinin family protein
MELPMTCSLTFQAPPAHEGIRKARRRLFLSCALAGALALGAAAQRAGAQTAPQQPAFQASMTVASGQATRTITGSGTETITIETPSAILNWQPTSTAPGTILFLPDKHTATFQNGQNVTDFAVLNRISTNQTIQFDGMVRSQLIGGAAPVTGGTVLFSSPGGIILGETAVFDVGKLVLTTLLVDDDNGTFISGDGTIRFRGGDDFPNSQIFTFAGSRIEALSQGSWVAMVSPRVDHRGAVRVNGSAAYIGAESVDMRVNNGLFDIVVNVGSSHVVPVRHLGSTGGPRSDGAGDHHRIYMVAVPKNNAVTLLLQGEVGFDAATTAEVAGNGEIILSAGNRQLATINGGVAAGDAAAPQATVDIRQATVTSNLLALATTNAFASAFANQTLNLRGDATLVAPNVQMSGEFGTVNVGGDAKLMTPGMGQFFQSSATSTSVALNALNGGQVNVAGDVLISASSAGFGSGASATGGQASVLVTQGGAVTIAGSLKMEADAFAGNGQTGGSATGGLARIFGQSGGTLTVAGGARLSAVGRGGDGLDGGGNGTGGTASISVEGQSSVTIGGDAFLNTDASGGRATDQGNGGIGQAGTSSIAAATNGRVEVHG